MDRKDGMRRLAMLLGFIGVLVGGFQSLNELKSILSYYKFRSLAESDFVRKEAASYIADVQRERMAYFDKEHTIESQISKLSGDHSPDDVITRGHLASQAGIFGWEASEKLSSIEKLHSEINRAGIKQIEWTYDYANKSIDPDFPWPRHLDVVSIETQEGQILYQKPAPQVWEYALLVLFPVIGFIGPWGIVRGIEWVWTGFSRSPMS